MLPVFGVRVSVTFHLMLVHNNFSLVWVAEWPSFGKKLYTLLAECSLYIWSICRFSFSRFGFEGGVWFLINPGSVHCLLVTFTQFRREIKPSDSRSKFKVILESRMAMCCVYSMEISLTNNMYREAYILINELTTCSSIISFE